MEVAIGKKIWGICSKFHHHTEFQIFRELEFVLGEDLRILTAVGKLLDEIQFLFFNRVFNKIKSYRFSDYRKNINGSPVAKQKGIKNDAKSSQCNISGWG